MYELFRLLLLSALFMFFWPFGEGGEVFPYPVYTAPNALFLLMTLFLWIRLGEFKAYLPLYLAGKFIAAVAFYGWRFFSAQGGVSEAGQIVRDLVLLGSGVVVGLGDALSVFGAWTLLKKIRAAEARGLPAVEDGAT